MQQTAEHLNREEPNRFSVWGVNAIPIPVVIALMAVTMFLDSRFPNLFGGWWTPRNYVFVGGMAYWLLRKGTQKWWQRRKKERMTATERLREISD